MEKKFQKNFLVLEIKAFILIMTRIHVIRSQRVTKQS